MGFGFIARARYPGSDVGGWALAADAGRRVIAWASRASGAIGIVAAVLYVGLFLGSTESGQLRIAAVWIAVMLATGLAAWSADRFHPSIGRRMLWLATGTFLVLGILSVLAIGLMYLCASLLAIFALVGRQTPDSAREE